jgi:hypothetical protein
MEDRRALGTVSLAKLIFTLCTYILLSVPRVGFRDELHADGDENYYATMRAVMKKLMPIS